jgi:hypothetical protein
MENNEDYGIPENTGKRSDVARLPDKKNHRDYPLTVRFFANLLPEEKTLLNQINNKNGVRQSEAPNFIYTRSDIHWFQYNDMPLPIKCPRSVGEKCPLCEQMFAEKNAAKPLQIQTKWDVERGFAILAAMSGDATPYVFRLKTTVRDLFFGKSNPTIEGKLKSFQVDYEEKVLDPYGEYGWFEITKAGTGTATKYFVEPVLTKIKEKGGMTTRPKAEAIHPDLVDLIKNPNNLPRLSEFITPDWDIEELEKLVESDGTWIPDRFKRKPKKDDKAKVEEPQDPNMLGIDQLPEFDEDKIPFN